MRGFFFVAFVFLISSLAAQGWVLDPLFGSQGKLKSPVKDFVTYRLLSTPSGLIAAGATEVLKVPMVFRFNNAGLADVDFNKNTSLKNTVSGMGGEWLGASLDSSGNVIVAGYLNKNGIANAAIAKFKTDGNLDSSFGTHGVLFFAIDNHRSNRITSILCSNKNIFFVGGSVNDYGTSTAFLGAVHLDGTFDSTVAKNGYVSRNSTGYGEMFHSIRLYHNRLYVACSKNTGVHSNAAVCVFKTNGEVDSTFGKTGLKELNFGMESIVKDILISKDGKIYGCGYSSDKTGNLEPILASWDTTGDVNKNLSDIGSIKGSISALSDYLCCLGQATNGDIFAFGSAYVGGYSQILSVRLSPSGIPESTPWRFSEIILEKENITSMVFFDGGIVLGGAFAITNQMTIAGIKLKSTLNQSNLNRKTNVKYFPNPTHQSGFLETDCEFDNKYIELFDALGRHFKIPYSKIILHDKISFELDLKNLKPGVYYFNFQNTLISVQKE